MKRNRLSGDERTLLDQWLINNATHVEFMEKYCPFTQLFNLLADWAAVDLHTDLTGNNIKKSWVDTAADRAKALTIQSPNGNGSTKGDDDFTNLLKRFEKLEQQMETIRHHRWSSLPQNAFKS